MREDDEDNEPTCIVDLEAEYQVRPSHGNRRVVTDAAPARELRLDLEPIINEALARTRGQLSAVLESHGVQQLNVTAKSDGDRVLEWGWSVQLTLVLAGKLPR